MTSVPTVKWPTGCHGQILAALTHCGTLDLSVPPFPHLELGTVRVPLFWGSCEDPSNMREVLGLWHVAGAASV